ncbi:hypothetical protein MPSEU_001016600 [Mayamaea pseudoterrestris]|nr:hypothetical protein MPSEU_001016600 [Mayamaea pseudoterrestris]
MRPDTSCIAVSKTARDALQAKWSAVSVGKYNVASTNHDQQVYHQMIHAMAHHAKATRPQTPLVNAGYAMRVTVMLHNMQSYLRFHRALSGSLQHVQIVILGAGLDVAGFWALSQLEHDDDQVHLVEIDVHSVWQAKRDAVTSLNWVVPSNEADNAHVWHGVPQVGKGQCRYSLVHADLRDTSKLQETLSFLQLDNPTLVCAELVLAYLGEQRCDDLLQWCSSNLCRHPMSCLIALEPLGSQTQESVLSGYQYNYVSQFTAKLNRGLADNGSHKGPLFDPLGANRASVIRRMHENGWTSSRILTCGDAAAEAVQFGADLICREVFDEHAALHLHLQSYVMVLGFKHETEHLLQRYMNAKNINERPLGRLLKDGSRIWLTEIERQDEAELRSQFSSTYQRYFDTYPAIKKMVKTALRKDLASSSVDGDDTSKIHLHYRSIDGHFLVAVQYPPMSNINSMTRILIGGIGWRKLSPKEQAARGFQWTSYEIHRLVVAPHSRRLGVARCLLERAESLIQHGTPAYQLIATTPVFQVDATAFYRGNGFMLLSEAEMGNITLQTYSKITNIEQGS